MEKMAAMLPSEHPYMRSTPVEIWKNRIPWLLLLMVSATLRHTPQRTDTRISFQTTRPRSRNSISFRLMPRMMDTQA